MIALLAKVGQPCCAGSGVRGGFSLAARNWQEQSLLLKLAALLATIIAGALAFAGCGVLLHIEELKELRDALRRRAKLIISRRSG